METDIMLDNSNKYRLVCYNSRIIRVILSIRSWSKYLPPRRKSSKSRNIFILSPLLFLIACLAQTNPQLDSLQEQISAMRVDIEEFQETRRDIKHLGSDIAILNNNLNKSFLNSIQRMEADSLLLLQNVADSKIQTKDLADEVSAIKESFDEHSQIIQNISNRIETLESNMVKQIMKLQAKIEQISPEKLYQTAQEFFINKHYHEAHKTFSVFIEQYPKHSFAERAWLFKGEALYHMGDLEKALAELELFASKNPQSSRLSSVIYLKAETLLALQRKSEAKEQFLRLTTDYPSSEEVSRAKLRLESLP